jgi:hypothetical protein
MHDEHRDFPHPGVLLNDDDATEALRIQYRTHRGQAPEHQEAVAQALQRYCASPDEARDTLAAIRQHERTTNSTISPGDIPAIVNARRAGEESIEGVIREEAQSREQRRRPTGMSIAQEDQELRTPRVHRPDKDRTPPPTSSQRVEEATQRAFPREPENQERIRGLLQRLRQAGQEGFTGFSPALVHDLAKSIRLGTSDQAILARLGVY